MFTSPIQAGNKSAIGLVGWVSQLLLLALLMSLAIWAARWGWAEVLAAEPRDVMERWKSGQAMPSDEELGRLDDLLARAQALNSQNADIAFDQGRFSEWMAAQYPLWTEKAHKHRGEAIEKFRRALDLRPTWGLAWVHLANSLILNQQLYAGGLDALEKAAVMAPLEAPVQQRVIWLGLSQWQVMDDELRGRMRSVVAAAFEHQQRLTIKIIVDFKLENEIAALFVGERLQLLLHKELMKRKARK
ncbi:hypothetical protein MNBD_GAMMA26-2624 [hydrothermal vent metagenome]|uniref:Uncharacterized protein n=1 Tax=hydrothermal vent metagenome TaxID=652676 RepID=A0A3B1B5Z8_9ZZZZ